VVLFSSTVAVGATAYLYQRYAAMERIVGRSSERLVLPEVGTAAAAR